jgi:hypothetical protein
LAGYNSLVGHADAFYLHRVDASGKTVWGDVRVENDPNLVAWSQIASLGDELFVAWVATGKPRRLGLAKFTP